MYSLDRRCVSLSRKSSEEAGLKVRHRELERRFRRSLIFFTIEHLYCRRKAYPTSIVAADDAFEIVLVS
jgi:hypothetical protein